MALCLKHKGNYSDEFWMLSFKVVPCTKSYAHSWSSCPCAHPGETARRRDPTQFNYQPVLCPNVKSKAGCPAGDSCGYAHNVFEQWLHPQRYKALMCTYGSQCTRPSCFFAHSLDELRVPWKGNSGSMSGGDQQQQQPHQATARVLASEIDAPAPAAGLNMNMGMGMGMVASGSASQRVDVGSDASGSLRTTVAASNVSMVGGSGGGGGILTAGGGSRGSSGSGRQLLMVHPVNVQHQQQQLQGAMPARVGGSGSGSGSHLVVDVRVMAGARAAAAAMAKPVVPVIMGGAGSSSDPGSAQFHSLPGYTSQPPGAQPSIRRPVGLPQPPSQSQSSQRSIHTAGTSTGTPSLEVDTNMFSLDGTGFPHNLTHLGPSRAGVLYRPSSNPSASSAHLMNLIEDSSFGGPGGSVGGGGDGMGGSMSVSGSLGALGSGGPGQGGVATGLGLGLASGSHAQELSYGASEGTATASLYNTPFSSQTQMTVSGLASPGLFGGTGQMSDTGPVGASGASRGGPAPCGGPPHPLQHHLQQLQQHQQQQARLQQQQQQQQLQQVAPHQIRGGGSGGGMGQAGSGQQTYPTMGRSQVPSSHLPQQTPGGQQAPYRAGMVAAGSGGMAGWASQRQQAPSHQHGSGPGVGGGGVELLSGGHSTSCCGSLSQSQDLCGQAQSTTMGILCDVDETEGLAGAPGDPLILLQHRSSTGSRDSSSALTGPSYPHQQTQRPGKQQQGKPVGHIPMVAGSGGSREGLHAAAGGSATMAPRPGDMDMEQAVHSRLQQLQLSAALAGDHHHEQQQQQQSMLSGLSFRPQLSTSPQPSIMLSTADPSSAAPSAAASLAAAPVSGQPQIAPDVEMLLLSSLQLQLSHAGLAGHPVVSSFPARDWLRQAVQGRSQEATRAFLMDLLSRTMPLDQVVAVRRLTECLDGAGMLLSCFAGPAGGASAVGPATDMAVTVPGAGSTSGTLGGGF